MTTGANGCHELLRLLGGQAPAWRGRHLPAGHQCGAHPVGDVERRVGPPTAHRVRPKDDGDRTPVPRDDDLLPRTHPVEDLGQGGTCLAGCHGCHSRNRTPPCSNVQSNRTSAYVSNSSPARQPSPGTICSSAYTTWSRYSRGGSSDGWKKTVSVRSPGSTNQYSGMPSSAYNPASPSGPGSPTTATRSRRPPGRRLGRSTASSLRSGRRVRPERSELAVLRPKRRPGGRRDRVAVVSDPGPLGEAGVVRGARHPRVLVDRSRGKDLDHLHPAVGGGCPGVPRPSSVRRSADGSGAGVCAWRAVRELVSSQR